MARLSKAALLAGLRGAVGKQLVFKQYGKKTVVSKYPDMTKITPSERQKEKRTLFAEAVAYAKLINRNPVQKATYLAKVKKGQSVYQYALKEYLQKKAGERKL